MNLSRGKYGNKKTVVDGIEFDSQKEAHRYYELCLLQKGGAIQCLRLQPRFEIVPKDDMGRALHYVADFSYIDNDEMVVEDVKGVKTPVYKLKKRLMYKTYGIKIRET